MIWAILVEGTAKGVSLVIATLKTVLQNMILKYNYSADF